MEDVKKWLDGERDYTEGVALFVKHGKNPSLKRFFLMKNNDYAKEKLVYELSKLAEVEYVPTVVDAEADNETGDDLKLLFD